MNTLRRIVVPVPLTAGVIDGPSRPVGTASSGSAKPSTGPIVNLVHHGWTGQFLLAGHLPC